MLPDKDHAAPSHTEIAGTAYPTRLMRGDADNVVLLPKFVENNLQFKLVNYVEVEDVNEALCEYRLLTTAFASTFAGDNIEWRDDIGIEDDRRSSVALENGRWVVRDG